MILYSTVGTSDMERAIRFYDSVFGALGVSRAPNWSDGWAGWGGSYDEGYGFWICSPFDGRPPAAGNGTMIAFRAKDEIQVQAFHAAALEWGGTDEGAPGTRPYYEPRFFCRVCTRPGRQQTRLRLPQAQAVI
jgi:catechol 2,3-dioxygenase-like lactoylglutathione lyase family enzyme